MTYLLIALFCVALDQLTKFLITSDLQWGQHIHLIPGVLGLTRLKNTGMAWSLMSESDFRWVLAVISVVVSIAKRNIRRGGRSDRNGERSAAGIPDKSGKLVRGGEHIFLVFVILYGARSIREEREKKLASMPELKRLRESREKKSGESENDEDNSL